MNILIIGCGRVGSQIAAALDQKGHDISIVDRNEESFDSLPADFSGFTTTGVPIDREVLKKAGIETCDAVCAVTPEDNMNIMAAELAAKIYNVPKVFARIVDIEKGEIFESYGIRTVCPTKLTVNAACAAIEEDIRTTQELRFEGKSVQFMTMDMPEELVGRQPSDIIFEENEILFAIVRPNGMMIMFNGQAITFGKEDKLIFAKKL